MARIKQIRDTSFLEIAQVIASANAYDIPDTPRLIRCFLPGHDDGSPSFSLREHTWKCFGCCRGGDAIDLVRALEGLELTDAVARIESLMGFGTPEEAVLALARRRMTPANERAWKRREEWRRDIVAIEDWFLEAVGPYLRSPDPLVRGLSQPGSEWVFEELHEVCVSQVPLISRTRRERLRELRAWTRGISSGISKRVLVVTGRDRLDVACCGNPVITHAPGFLEFAKAWLKLNRSPDFKR